MLGSQVLSLSLPKTTELERWICRAAPMSPIGGLQRGHGLILGP